MASSQREPKKQRSKYNSKYLESFHDEWECIRKSSKSDFHAYCGICNTDVSVKSGGRNDVLRHIVTDKHKQLAAALSTVKPGGLDAYFARSTDNTVINAECLFTGFIVEHNLPVNASDHTGQLFRRMFPDSKIAAKYHCGRTKAQAIINTMAESSREEIAQSARTQPFSWAGPWTPRRNARYSGRFAPYVRKISLIGESQTWHLCFIFKESESDYLPKHFIAEWFITPLHYSTDPWKSIIKLS